MFQTGKEFQGVPAKIDKAYTQRDWRYDEGLAKSLRELVELTGSEPVTS